MDGARERDDREQHAGDLEQARERREARAERSRKAGEESGRRETDRRLAAPPSDPDRERDERRGEQHPGIEERHAAERHEAGAPCVASMNASAAASTASRSA